MHPHATTYARVGFAAWSASTPAGDAAASLATVRAQRHALVRDARWGWCGRIAGGQRLEDLALACCGTGVSPVRGALPPTGGTPVPRPPTLACGTGVSPVRGVHPTGGTPVPRLPAIGIGASKGNIAAVGERFPVTAFPGWDDLSGTVARRLGIDAFIPCASVAACSTGLACVLSGADLIERSATDIALVGAAESSLTPLVVAGFANAGVLCGSTLPQAFAEPTGFAPAEGAASFLLTSQPAATAWRLRAGVRLGDAGHETHFLDPRTLATALAALWDLLPSPDLIVCHATGTAAGDRYERAGLAAGPWGSIPRLVCKPWLGHALGASGAIELALGLECPIQRLWKISLGFGGHLVALAAERTTGRAA